MEREQAEAIMDAVESNRPWYESIPARLGLKENKDACVDCLLETVCQRPYKGANKCGDYTRGVWIATTREECFKELKGGGKNCNRCGNRYICALSAAAGAGNSLRTGTIEIPGAVVKMTAGGGHGPVEKEDGTAGGATHYQIGDKQPIEVMQDVMTPEEFFGYLRGNAIKYSLRMGHKDSKEIDAKKAAQYSKWMVQALAGKTIDPREG